ncbi:hypothetical protein L1887_48117 [Cichorium endivia]|nr:hypothetical protein L1887_48117 [Cichorium endivia]
MVFMSNESRACMSRWCCCEWEADGESGCVSVGVALDDCSRSRSTLGRMVSSTKSARLGGDMGRGIELRFALEFVEKANERGSILAPQTRARERVRARFADDAKEKEELVAQSGAAGCAVEASIEGGDLGEEGREEGPREAASAEDEEDDLLDEFDEQGELNEVGSGKGVDDPAHEDGTVEKMLRMEMAGEREAVRPLCDPPFLVDVVSEERCRPPWPGVGRATRRHGVDGEAGAGDAAAVEEEASAAYAMLSSATCFAIQVQRFEVISGTMVAADLFRSDESSAAPSARMNQTAREISTLLLVAAAAAAAAAVVEDEEAAGMVAGRGAACPEHLEELLASKAVGHVPGEACEGHSGLRAVKPLRTASCDMSSSGWLGLVVKRSGTSSGWLGLVVKRSGTSRWGAAGWSGGRHDGRSCWYGSGSLLRIGVLDAIARGRCGRRHGLAVVAAAAAATRCEERERRRFGKGLASLIEIGS